ncbi:competence protein CoiA [Halovulum marinum]|nr:competence protein CoiA family protein [Halovulum marinum]
MRFAIVDKARVEATPGARGSCPGCGADLVAKCGDRKVWHWAHKGRCHCDPWWENETEWHRRWKGQFPAEWQEIPLRDAYGELHIADLRTPSGRVVELQHSAIDRGEILARTAFHRSITWVVDGLRRKTDAGQFSDALSCATKHRLAGGIVYEIRDVDWVRLTRDWAGISCPVLFDFGAGGIQGLGPGTEDLDDLCMLRARRLSQDGAVMSVYGFFLPRAQFIACIRDGKPLPWIEFDGVTPKAILTEKRPPPATPAPKQEARRAPRSYGPGDRSWTRISPKQAAEKSEPR